MKNIGIIAIGTLMVISIGVGIAQLNQRPAEIQAQSSIEKAKDHYENTVAEHNQLIYETLIASKKAMLTATEAYQIEKKNAVTNGKEIASIAERLTATQNKIAEINSNELAPDVQWVSSKMSQEEKMKQLEKEVQELKK